MPVALFAICAHTSHACLFALMRPAKCRLPLIIYIGPQYVKMALSIMRTDGTRLYDSITWNCCRYGRTGGAGGDRNWTKPIFTNETSFFNRQWWNERISTSSDGDEETQAQCKTCTSRTTDTVRRLGWNPTRAKATIMSVPRTRLRANRTEPKP